MRDLKELIDNELSVLAANILGEHRLKLFVRDICVYHKLDKKQRLEIEKYVLKKNFRNEKITKFVEEKITEINYADKSS